LIKSLASDFFCLIFGSVAYGNTMIECPGRLGAWSFLVCKGRDCIIFKNLNAKRQSNVPGC